MEGGPGGRYSGECPDGAGPPIGRALVGDPIHGVNMVHYDYPTPVTYTPEVSTMVTVSGTKGYAWLAVYIATPCTTITYRPY